VVEEEQYSTPAKMVRDGYNVTLTVRDESMSKLPMHWSAPGFFVKFADNLRKST